MSHSYPDPTAGRDGNGPFFNQTPQQARRPSNDMELSQLAHEMNPTMNTRQIVPQMGTNMQDPRQASMKEQRPICQQRMQGAPGRKDEISG